MSSGALHDGRGEDRFVWPDFVSGSVCRGRDGRDGSARRQPTGEQFPARRIGFWGARGASDDQGRAGSKAERSGAARQPGAAAGKFFGGAKGTAKRGVKTVAGLRNTDENSGGDVAERKGLSQLGNNRGCTPPVLNIATPRPAEAPGREPR